MYKPKLLAKNFGLYINTQLYGLLLWKEKYVRVCGVDIAYQQLSDLTRLQWALHI